jgi:hypothetical protein
VTQQLNSTTTTTTTTTIIIIIIILVLQPGTSLDQLRHNHYHHIGDTAWYQP